MSGVTFCEKRSRSPPIQPLDRHLSEIAESDGTTYINAGIDSTCCQKRSRTVHKLTGGIVVPTKTRRCTERCVLTNNECCLYCGK